VAGDTAHNCEQRSPFWQSYAVARGKAEKARTATLLGARGFRIAEHVSLVRLQKMVERSSLAQGTIPVHGLMKELSDAGYARLVREYWKNNKAHGGG